MSPTKISIPAALAAVLLLLAPAALAQETAAPVEEAPEAGAAIEASDDTAAPLETAGEELAPGEEAMAGAEAAEADGAPDESAALADAAPDESAALADAAPDESAALADAATDEGAAPAAQDPAVEAIPLSEDPADLAAATEPPLGAVGYDSKGRQGRIHFVVRGDTLWDISNAYLGTPWVWPSIWNDNGEIENPHLIYPGDRIWITPNEMRRITEEEAAVLLSNLPPQEPAAQEEMAFDEPTPEPEPEPMIEEPIEYGSVRVSNRESAGLITPDQMEASGSIVGRDRERLMLSQEDEVHIGLGEDAVEVGDQLTVFRTHEKVFDPDTGVLLGYHVEFLGWVEVEETSPETSLARIGMSNDPLEEGDRVMPRSPLPIDVALKASPDVEGKISFFPQKRVVIGYNDFVYLNRGSIDGLEVGSPLDVYRPGYAADEPARDETVMVPDTVIGRLVVVRTEDQSSVAWVMRSRTELALGDRFRGADR